ncbi:hypothetical protein [Thalassobacillus hwangdonensis]|uniref:Uncharacterized protein n=1 Tax=Thalassobacillus hwangdonensis TaxID=546108 RepID=A0ABW3KYK2_9BACI
MGTFVLDMALIGGGIIVLTAFIAVIVNGIGTKWFSKGEKDEFLEKSRSYQTTWRKVGGNKK